MEPLYKYTLALDALFEEHVDPETGAIDDSALEALEQLEAERDEKARNCARYRQVRKVQADAIKAEIQRLQKLQKRHQRVVDWLGDYLGEHVPKGHNIDDPAVPLTWRRSPGAAVYTGPERDMLTVTPVRYLVLQDPKVNREALLRDLRAGKKIPNWELAKPLKLRIG